MFTYTVYGLRIASDFALPELVPFAPDEGDTEQADIVIRREADLPTLEDATGESVLYAINPQAFTLNIPGCARYYVEAGCTISVVPYPDAEEATIRLFLFGTVWAMALYQRGDLVLHGSAIKTPTGAVIFTGISGAGKSTTASAFVQKGYPLLADDLCVVRRGDDGINRVFPGVQVVRLWQQALTQLAYDPPQKIRVRPELQKYAVPLKQPPLSPQPIRMIYILNPTNEPDISLTPLHGLHKVGALLNHLYRKHLLDEMGRTGDYILRLSQMFEQTPVTRLSRPRFPVMLGEVIQTIETNSNDFSMKKEQS